jgi:hypothetical protein
MLRAIKRQVKVLLLVATVKVAFWSAVALLVLVLVNA